MEPILVKESKSTATSFRLIGDASPGWSPGLNRLKLILSRNAPTDFLNDPGQGDPHGDLYQPDIFYFSNQGKSLGSRTVRGLLFLNTIVRLFR